MNSLLTLSKQWRSFLLFLSFPQINLLPDDSQSLHAYKSNRVTSSQNPQLVSHRGPFGGICWSLCRFLGWLPDRCDESEASCPSRWNPMNIWSASCTIAQTRSLVLAWPLVSQANTHKDVRTRKFSSSFSTFSSPVSRFLINVPIVSFLSKLISDFVPCSLDCRRTPYISITHTHNHHTPLSHTHLLPYI